MRGPVTSASPRVDVLDVKQSVRAATTAALPASTYSGGVLTADANGALAAQDGVTLVAGERLLVKDQASGLQNGIYVVTQVGTAGTPWILTRASDADTSAEVTAGLFVWVSEGTTSWWTLTTADPITLGTTALTFAQHGPITAGAGLTKTGNTIDVGAGVGITVNANDVAVATGFAFAWTEAHTWTKNAIGTAQTAGTTVRNTTAAAAGAQQYGPMVSLGEGQGWDSTAGASKKVEWWTQVRPVQTAGDPTSVLDFFVQSNAGGLTKPMTLDSAGALLSLTKLSVGSVNSTFQESGGQTYFDGLAAGFNIRVNEVNAFKATYVSSAVRIGFYSTTPVAQGAAIADASGGATIDAEARTALNALLARLRPTAGVGLIAA